MTGIVAKQDMFLDKEGNLTYDAEKASSLLASKGCEVSTAIAEKYGLQGKTSKIEIEEVREPKAVATIAEGVQIDRVEFHLENKPTAVVVLSTKERLEFGAKDLTLVGHKELTVPESVHGLEVPEEGETLLMWVTLLPKEELEPVKADTDQVPEGEKKQEEPKESPFKALGKAVTAQNSDALIAFGIKDIDGLKATDDDTLAGVPSIGVSRLATIREAIKKLDAK